CAALGLRFTRAEPQTEPIRIDVLGSTSYDEDALSKVRPPFKGRGDRVYVTKGQGGKRGDPLVDLYSTGLAEAKSSYEVKRIQWLYDDTLVKIREPLLKSKAISRQAFLETQNTEMKSRTDAEVARDKLLVYGLTEAEISKVEREVGS